MAYVDSLKLARDQLVTQLVALTAQYSPDVNIDGQGVQHGAQLERLNKQIDALNVMIAKAQPFRVVSQVL